MIDLPTLPTPCSVEIFRRNIPGVIYIYYYVSEGPTRAGTLPTRTRSTSSPGIRTT